MTRVLVVSDTHGLLRPELDALLDRYELVIHAGDVGDASILQRLGRAGAPVIAVRGNNDRDAWAEALPLEVRTRVGGLLLHVIHDLADLDADAGERADVVISGHSHQPRIERRAGVLYLNPGSAGRRRFRLPVSAAELVLRDGRAQAALIDLLG
jgi:uncharacterized protein